LAGRRQSQTSHRRTVSSTPILQCSPANISLSSQVTIARHTPLAQVNLLTATPVYFHSLIQHIIGISAVAEAKWPSLLLLEDYALRSALWGYHRILPLSILWEAQASSIPTLTLSLFILLPLLLVASCIDSGLLVEKLAL
jgi:hypothetical protein